MPAKLIDSDGHEHLLVGDKPVIIGRLEKRCQVVLAHESVSREHAKIFTRGATYTIADLNSANGTFVNGQRVTRHDLAPGDSVTLGKVTLRFAIEPDAAAVDEITLEAAADPPPSPPLATRAAATTAAADPFAGDPDVAAAEVSWQRREPAGAPPSMPAIKQRDEILQFHAQPRTARGGWLGQDLAQRPLWFQALLLLCALLLAGALFVSVRTVASKIFGAAAETNDGAQ
ncbi:MAG: FHA domain-containing protein [Planctomycetota bacterium]